jgi:hypothetical protein
MTPQDGQTVSRILQERCGIWSLVDLTEERRIRVLNIAWGRDIGADFDHITTNISPKTQGKNTIDFFHASEVVRISDGETGKVLFPQDP